MKSYETDDELERALFALELEEPPADLRASILAATVYRPPMPVKPWELWLAGGLFALMVWLSAIVLHGGGAPALSVLEAIGSVVLRLGQPATLFWIAIGGAAAFWLSQANLIMAPMHYQASRR